MKKLMGYIRRHRWLMIIGPLFKLIEAVLELLNPILVARIIDFGVSTGNYYYILKYGLIILVCNIVGFIFSAIGQKCASLVSTKVAAEIRDDMFKQISSFSHAELDKFGTASLVNRITNDVNQVENAISMFMRRIMRFPFLLLGALVLSLIINVKMSIVFLVLIPLVSLILVIYTMRTNPYFKQIRQKLDKISRTTKENLSGTRVVRAFNKQQAEQVRFEGVSADYTTTNIRVSRITSFIEPLILLIVDAATIALLAIGGWEISIGGMTQGDVIALIDYVAIITISLLMISEIIASFVRTNASLHRINQVFDTTPAIRNVKWARTQTNLEYDAIMEFKDVCFNYTLDPKEKSFIKDLSFKIMPHQTIGIIGGTGSGKTTIANLMTRFYDVTQGEILYKGKNIKDFPLTQLRHEVSIVQQRSTLFSGSLRENMKLRNKHATDEEIIEALKVSQAWGFVSDWSNLLDYKIMAGGKNVSGGQMQRLTIARALIDKPELLILDDSSSALDFLTDSRLRHALKQLDMTMVIISQRATSIKSADVIIVLDNGDVVGIGKHDALLKNCPIYKEIYESQSK